MDVSFWRWMVLGVPASLLMIPFAWWILRWLFPPEIDRLPITAEAIRDAPARARAAAPRRDAARCSSSRSSSRSGCSRRCSSLERRAHRAARRSRRTGRRGRAVPARHSRAVVEGSRGAGRVGRVMMIVAGLSLGLAVYDSGAARWLAWVLLGQITSVPDALRPFVIVLAVAGLHLLFSSNTVTASIIIPILVALATDLHLDPWTTVAPAAFTSSLAFVLVSEGPTTIIPYSSGYFSIRDMAKAGIRMTLAAAACVAATQYVERALSLDLRAVHDAPRSRIERVAAVHDAAVVPQHEVAGAPLVAPRQRIGGRDVPDPIEQRVRLVERQPFEPRVAASAEIQMPSAGLRMHADERMQRAGRGARVVARRDAGADVSAAVVRAVVLDAQLQRGRAQSLGERTPRRRTSCRSWCRHRSAAPRARRATLAFGGSGRYDMSVCHTASPAPRLPMATPFSTTFETT